MPVDLAVFKTDLGWYALSGRDGLVCSVTIGHRSAAAARQGARASLGSTLRLRDWNPELRCRLERHAAGEAVEFQDVAVELGDRSAFCSRVLAACRAIPYGAVRTYAALAAESGHSTAARAVGAAMARNPIPIIIPCHRVVRSDGGLGGFSAPQGVRLKRRLLQLENRNGDLPLWDHRARRLGVGS